jgi:acyl-coenzyme A synthetase/AMP-(fatty) acid ligase
MLAAALCGKAFSCLNPRMKWPQIAATLSLTRAERLFCDRYGARVLTRSGGHEAAASIVQFEDRLKDDAESIDADVRQLSALALNHDGARPACCLFTSGSTGVPKGVLISGDDLTKRAATEVGCYRIVAADRLLNLLPFAFDVGLNQALTSLLCGAPLVVMDSWLPRDLLAAVERHGITGISAVPAVWRDLLASGLEVDTIRRHRTLRYVTVSGGSLTVPELRALADLMGNVSIIKTYGQTETFRSTILFPSDLKRKIGSVGKAFPGTCVRVLADDGRECDPGQVGEVVHSGLGTMLGYLDGSDEACGKRRSSRSAGISGTSESEIWTGDAGYLDTEGFLYLKGRQDSMLKIAGNRFYPDEVSTAISTIPGISDNAIIASVADGTDPELVAFVVARDRTLSAEHLRAHLRDKLPSYMVPSAFRFVAAIPRLANGKTDYLALQAFATGE